jgi:hypothetical protein
VVKRTFFKLRRLGVVIVFGVAGVLVAPVALAWRARADLIEATGAACLAYFVAAQVERGGWLVAAVALITKGAELDRRSRVGKA